MCSESGAALPYIFSPILVGFMHQPYTVFTTTMTTLASTSDWSVASVPRFTFTHNKQPASVIFNGSGPSDPNAEAFSRLQVDPTDPSDLVGMEAQMRTAASVYGYRARACPGVFRCEGPARKYGHVIHFTVGLDTEVQSEGLLTDDVGGV